MNHSPGALEVLTTRVDELEKRVRALEHPAPATATIQRSEPTINQPNASPSALETGSFFPIIGRAMLGIAGAYVLRALAELATSSKLPISLFAVAYAFAWLVWSARTSSSMARISYAATSVLVLAPMLWENTLVFHVFKPMMAAGVLAAFLTLTTALDLRSDSVRGIWIAQSVAAVITAAFAFRTREVLPFVTALLLAVLVSEFARTRRFAQPLWPLLVLVTDLSVCGLIFVYSGAPDTRAAYPHLSTAALIVPASALFALNGAALAVRVVAKETRITVLEMIQVVIAFALTAIAILYFSPLRGPAVLGVTSIALSASAYFCAFRYLRCRDERRSFRVFAIWSAALLVAGSLWALPRPFAAILLALAAATAMYFSKRLEPEMLQFHGVLFLLTAGVLAGLPQYLYDCMAGTPPHSLSAPLVVLAMCAVAAVAISAPPLSDAWNQLLHLVPSLVAICGVTAFLVHGVLVAAGTFAGLEVQHIAFLRTLTICVTALAIAFGGSRLGRSALTHLAYIALAFLAAKLFFEDLRHGHMEFIAGSIGLFAITLMATPRLVRIGARRQTGTSTAALHSKHLVP
jgi:hypothetical protein